MNYKKYPRTPHLPWSISATSDDVWSDANFVDQEVIVTEKMDGECTTMYSDHIHARSISSNHHPSRSWVKQLHASIQKDIPQGWRICGENLFAYHSILYTDLPSYFMCFGIYDDKNTCLSWDDTVDLCTMLGLETVPVIYRGKYDEYVIRNIWQEIGSAFPVWETQKPNPISVDDFDSLSGRGEGYVVRSATSFTYDDFAVNVAKYVRANHVKPDSGHWASKTVFPNLLKD